MGLLDKAKDMKKEEGAEAPEPEAKEETSPDSEKKLESSPEKKLVKKKKSGKKKLLEPSSGKKKKKKSAGKKSAPAKKKAAPKKKKAAKPKVKKEKAEPVEPQIEGLPEDLEWATPGSRITAQLIDGVILAVMLLVLGIVCILALDTAGFVVAIVIYLILPFVYFLMMEGNTGQTFGKRMAHVKIISFTGRPLNPKMYLKSALWKGFFYPWLNIIDGVVGVWVLHKDEQMRISQYNDELIAVAVAKKTLKFGAGEEETAEDGGEEEAPEGGDQEGSDIPMDEPKTEDTQ